jgi:hypothetical protein
MLKLFSLLLYIEITMEYRYLFVIEVVGGFKDIQRQLHQFFGILYQQNSSIHKNSINSDI